MKHVEIKVSWVRRDKQKKIWPVVALALFFTTILWQLFLFNFYVALLKNGTFFIFYNKVNILSLPLSLKIKYGMFIKSNQKYDDINSEILSKFVEKF